ncbi:hypothetical protein B0H14DRAFT_2633770 [Mycena olivaceomarginata]|nr:hypothetical protein B0H14DRAFT_2633770 [Mycena olivaceomarginata]
MSRAPTILKTAITRFAFIPGRDKLESPCRRFNQLDFLSSFLSLLTETGGPRKKPRIRARLPVGDPLVYDISRSSPCCRFAAQTAVGVDKKEDDGRADILTWTGDRVVFMDALIETVLGAMMRKRSLRWSSSYEKMCDLSGRLHGTRILHLASMRAGEFTKLPASPEQATMKPETRKFSQEPPLYAPIGFRRKHAYFMIDNAGVRLTRLRVATDGMHFYTISTRRTAKAPRHRIGAETFVKDQIAQLNDYWDHYPEEYIQWVRRRSYREPKQGICDAILFAALPGFHDLVPTDIEFIIDARAAAPRQTYRAQSGSAKQVLDNPFNICTVDPWMLRTQAAHEAAHTNVLQFLGHLILPHFVAEYKKRDDKDGAKALNQGRMYLVLMVAFYTALGVEDYPFFHVGHFGEGGSNSHSMEVIKS